MHLNLRIMFACVFEDRLNCRGEEGLVLVLFARRTTTTVVKKIPGIVAFDLVFSIWLLGFDQYARFIGCVVVVVVMPSQAEHTRNYKGSRSILRWSVDTLGAERKLRACNVLTLF